ncbi:MAG: SRPBCC family protein [Nocardioides sp.]|uniref:SRPBCC family protein n=1 Tax=Nocardioides sp. TaxID=35761 RepID=UPI0032654E38
MLLTNEFEVETDLEQTWTLLTDLERIMPCLPGASLDGRDGENYHGSVKIKVGPISAHFKGTAFFAQKDDVAHTAVISASGKDPKGQAAANAQIAARLEPVGPTRTRVLIDTELDISGRMAQFGRGAIADVSNRLMGQFADNLSVQLVGSPSGAVPVAGPAAVPAGPTQFAAALTPPAAAPAAADMDLMSLVLPMVKERYGQAIAGGLIGFVLSWLAFGRKR